jgi:hypothetical protein
MTPTLRLLVLGAIAFAVSLSCSGFDTVPGCCGPVATGGQSASGGGGSGGMGTGGNGGTGCQRQEYREPGCGADARLVCTNGTGGACFALVCGCDGHVESGCGLYPAPYAYAIPGGFSYDGGDMCDPSASP